LTVAERVRWTVPAELAGERLDRIVAVLGAVSRSVARGLVDAGEVSVDGERGWAAARIAAGRTVEASVPEQEAEPAGADIAFGVVVEDASFVVVDKPAGLVVHPGAGHRGDTLLNGLIARYPELKAVGPDHRWGIVHRLDRGTSGLLVVARTAAAHAGLVEALRRRLVERRYLALANGVLEADTGTIDAPLGRDAQRPTRMALDPRGRAARTHYRVAATWSGYTLAAVRLETGRTHQIRVHFSSIGAPLVGDATYGAAGGVADPGRVWLHATELRFPHPIEDRTVVARSPLPADLVASLERLGTPLSGTVPGTDDNGGSLG
jgi:23S rRNA pseudouridine1911/1915/1917 synthase